MPEGYVYFFIIEISNYFYGPFCEIKDVVLKMFNFSTCINETNSAIFFTKRNSLNSTVLIDNSGLEIDINNYSKTLIIQKRNDLIDDILK